MRRKWTSTVHAAAVVVLAITAPAQEWRTLSGTPGRSPWTGAFDARRHRFVEFGELDEQLTEWSGSAWTPLTLAAAGPSPRAGYGVAYDSRHGRVCLFGGAGSSTAQFADLWYFDGLTWTAVAATGPSVRQRMAIAYDPVQDRLFVHAGYRASPVGTMQLFDTWSFDGQQWAFHGALSPWRSGACMVFDAARSDLLLLAAGTFRWQNNWWQQIAVDGADEGSRLCYDAVWQRVVHYRAPTQPALLEWDGTSWAAVQMTGVPATITGALWFDPVRGQSLLHCDDKGLRSWDGSTLQQLPYDRQPQYACYIADPFRRCTVAFGGNRDGVMVDETWIWDGRAWQQVFPATRPPPRWLARGTFDLRHGVALMFGGVGAGLLNDLWAWNGSDWALLSSSGPLNGADLAYDLWRGRTVVGVRGFPLGTWEWDGSTWSISTDARGLNSNSRLASDLIRGRTVSYDGSVNPPQTWEWDGVAWSRVVTPHHPPQTPDVWPVYDLSRARIALVGASAGFGVWEYDGVDWTLRQGVGNYSPGALVYDFARQGITLFGTASVQTLLSAPERSDAYGTQCGPTPTVLMVRTPPRLDEPDFALELAVSPGDVAAFGIAAGQASVPLGSGCTLWIGPTIAEQVTTVDARGLATWPIPIPAAPALRGLSLYAQGGAIDAAGSIRTSQGLHLVVAD